MRSIVLLYVIERAMFGWSIGRALHDANKLTVPSNTSLDYLHEALADFMCEKFAWIAINLKALNDAREIGIGFDRCSFYMEIQDQVPGLKIDIYDGKLSSNLLPRSTKKFAQVKVFDTMDKFMSNEQKISRYQENGIPIIVVILQGKHGKLNQVSIAIFNDTRLKKDSPEKRLFDAISTKVLTDSVGKGYAEGWRSCDLSW